MRAAAMAVEVGWQLPQGAKRQRKNMRIEEHAIVRSDLTKWVQEQIWRTLHNLKHGCIQYADYIITA